MQPLSSRKIGWPKFFPSKLRLCLVASITSAVLVIFFSSAAESENGAGSITPPAICPAQMIKNGGFELPLSPAYNPYPLNWSTGQSMPVVHFSRVDRNVRSGGGASLTSLLDQLAKRKLIRPMMTQGHIRDFYKNLIVVDAMTTQGSSGTPMFGETGEVIGVTFAFMADDATSNFVARIQGAIEQLSKAGWKAHDNKARQPSNPKKE